jgi:hypothetical protein
MKKIEIFILLLGLTLGGIIGYVMENHNKDRFAEMQRDRLSDYIRIYEDIQAEEKDPTTKLQEVINELEKEDNLDPNLGFKMKLDDWVFAY